MGLFSAFEGNSGAYQQAVDSGDHQSSISHELIAGAASYEAAKAYEKHVTATNGGVRPSHEEAKEILAGLAGGFIDKEAETRGLDFVDREKAKRQAADNINQNYDPNEDLSQQNNY